MTRSEKLLRELIALPSVNPAFLPVGDARAGEQRVGEFLAATLASAGCEVEFQEVFAEKPLKGLKNSQGASSTDMNAGVNERGLAARRNLIARVSPRGRVSRRVVLAPHLDTVNGSAEQFVPSRRGSKLFGRGASDAKGSAAVMALALCELAGAGRRSEGTEIVFAGLVDEESTQAGARALASSNLDVDLAIVGEPTLCQVVTAHKGSLWLRLETRGKAAHGSRPELGVNAVREMAEVVVALEGTYATELRFRRKHRLLGRATVNVGKISGGSQANIVPDACWIMVDRRTLPGETEKSVWWEIQKVLRRRGLRVDFVESRQSQCLPMETSARLPLVRQFLRCAGQKRPVGVNFCCDAWALSREGMPSVVFGPGDIAQGHTSDEWIEVRELEKAKDVLLKFLRSLIEP